MDIRQESACHALCRHLSKKPDDLEKGIAFDRKLYIARREFEQSNDNTYVCSMEQPYDLFNKGIVSGWTASYIFSLIFKALIMNLRIALVHSRFSYQHKSKLGESTSKPSDRAQW